MKLAIQMTMFHVKNYGSALQAYALQQAVESVPGWRCEVLNIRPWTVNGVLSFDRRSPPPRRKSLSERLLRLALHAPSLFSEKVREWHDRRFVRGPLCRIFDDFVARELHLTARFENGTALREAPPVADAYITGSDQTLNPNFTGGDSIWFFDFLPPRGERAYRKLCYSSSFAVASLPERQRQAYAKGLGDYDALSFREQSGVALAESLGLRGSVCCDPTLLLDRAQWAAFACRSPRRPRGGYILCYNLRYMADPYPMAGALERELARRLRLPVVHLDPLAPRRGTFGRVIRDATPSEFVDFFLNASFVMTSSFHGTAFALQSGRPFMTYVVADRMADSRAADLLVRCGAECHMVTIDQTAKTLGDLSRFAPREEERERLEAFRSASRRWLMTALEPESDVCRKGDC